MAEKFRRGFKREAEEMALRVRAQLGLSWREALDPQVLAAHVRVPVVELRELRKHGLSEKALRHLMNKGSREFSAALFECGNQRLIVHNTVHSSERRASNIVHELSHILLKHLPPKQIIQGGCRRWDASMEGEADWLAAELLVPRRAAVELARQEVSEVEAAKRYGVTIGMIRWRLNATGARIQAQRERNARVTR